MFTFVSFRDSSDEEQAGFCEIAVTTPQPGQEHREERSNEQVSRVTEQLCHISLS